MVIVKQVDAEAVCLEMKEETSYLCALRFPLGLEENGFNAVSLYHPASERWQESPVSFRLEPLLNNAPFPSG